MPNFIAARFSSFSDLAAAYAACYRPALLAEHRLVRQVVQGTEFSDMEKAEVVLIGEHQRRLSSVPRLQAHRAEALRHVAATLGDFRHYDDFEALYADVCAHYGGDPWVGPLTRYDMARRIGAALPEAVQPQDFVYLESEAYMAACCLLDDKDLTHCVPLGVFPAELAALGALHVERALGVFRRVISRGATIPSHTFRLPRTPLALRTDLYSAALQEKLRVLI